MPLETCDSSAPGVICAWAQFFKAVLSARWRETSVLHDQCSVQGCGCVATQNRSSAPRIPHQHFKVLGCPSFPGLRRLTRIFSRARRKARGSRNFTSPIVSSLLHQRRWTCCSHHVLTCGEAYPRSICCQCAVS